MPFCRNARLPLITCECCCPVPPTALQYNEPLVVKDLQAEQLKKYDGIVQYSRDKRRQVRVQGKSGMCSCSATVIAHSDSART